MERIREGDASDALHFLWQRGNAERDQWSTINLDKLATEFDQQIADAARAGFIARWREMKAPLRRDRIKGNEVPLQAIFGLIGLEIEFSSGLRAATLSPAEAQLAAGYAVWEMNGFPSWLEDVASAHPDSLSQVLDREIDGEFALSDDASGRADVIRYLGTASPAVQTIGVDALTRRLRSGDPQSTRILGSVLQLVPAGTGGIPSELARQRADSLVESGAQLLWWVQWANGAQEAASARLESTTGNLAEIQRTRLLGRIAATAFGGPDHEHPRLSRPPIPIIGRLYLLFAGVGNETPAPASARSFDRVPGGGVARRGHRR